MELKWMESGSKGVKSGIRRSCPGIVAAGLLLASGGTAASAQTAASCAALAKLDMPEATITMAQVVQPAEFKIPARVQAPGGGPGGPGGPPGQGARGQGAPAQRAS